MVPVARSIRLSIIALPFIPRFEFRRASLALLGLLGPFLAVVPPDLVSLRAQRREQRARHDHVPTPDSQRHGLALVVVAVVAAVVIVIAAAAVARERVRQRPPAVESRGLVAAALDGDERAQRAVILELGVRACLLYTSPSPRD